MIQRMSLRTRFVLFSLACLLPLALAAAWFLNQGIERNTRQVVANQTSIATTVDLAVAEYFERNLAALQSLAVNGAITSMDPAMAEPVLGQASTIWTEIPTFFLIDIDGRIISPSTSPPRSLESIGDQVVQTMANRQPLLSDRIVVDDETVVIVLTIPVVATTDAEPAVNDATGTGEDEPEPTPTTETTPPGQVVGVVGSVIRVDMLEQLVLPLAIEDTEIAVVRSNEILLATSGVRQDEAAFLDANAEAIERARSGRTDDFRTDDTNGTEHIGVFRPTLVAGYTWATIVTHPAPSSYAQTLWPEGLLVLGLAALAIVALGVVLGELAARPLRVLARRATAIRQGDFSTRIDPVGSGEVLALSRAVSGVTRQLEDHAQSLEEVRRMREDQTRQMRDLLRRTLRLQEDEQRRIASEIHDAVSPLITGALYHARALEMTNGSTPHEESQATLANVNQLLERATQELHGVIFDLRPPDLDDIGVVAAIEAYVGTIQRTGLNVRLDLGEEPAWLTPDVRLGMYRIVQEALHNVVRHSSADEALVHLESTDELLRLTIRDNGAGFDPDTAIRPTSLGLLSMRERAAAIGASLTIVSRPGGGTAIILERAHTETVMSDDVLANLISVEGSRLGHDGHDGADLPEPPAPDGETVHNGASTPHAEGAP